MQAFGRYWESKDEASPDDHTAVAPGVGEVASDSVCEDSPKGDRNGCNDLPSLKAERLEDDKIGLSTNHALVLLDLGAPEADVLLVVEVGLGVNEDLAVEVGRDACVELGLDAGELFR